MAKMTMKELERKLRRYMAENPKAVIRALTKGVKLLRAGVQANLSGPVLNARSGRLRRGAKMSVRRNPLSARVYIDAKQLYKAKTFMAGTTLHHPGGTPYFFAGGKLIFVRKDAPWSKNLPRTKPHAIPMPQRDFMRPALEDNREAIVAAIAAELIHGYVHA